MSILMPNLAFPPPAPAFPSAAPVSYFGLTAAERGLQSVAPGLASAPTSFSAFAPAVTEQQQRQLQMMQQLTAGAVGPGNDPTQWSPEEAAAQTDRALARIGQANPELAQLLQEQRMGQAGLVAPQGAGFWDGLKQAAATVLGAPGIKELFDIISRPSHIIPEILMDRDEPIWKNVSDALLGKSDVSWDDVLVTKFGMERNWMTATLGFVGDVATDPLTYLTFGMGGASRELAATTASRLTFKETAKAGLLAAESEGKLVVGKLVDDLASFAGDSIKSIDDVLDYMWKARTQGGGAFRKTGMPTVDSIVEGMQRVHPDAVGGYLHRTLMEAERFVLEDGMRVAANAWDAAYRGNWSRLTDDLAKQLGIPKKQVDEQLRGLIAPGNQMVPWGTPGSKAAKAAYMEGKAASALLGGVRFRMAVPIIGLRIQSARALPYTSRLNFSVGRRFFAGMSGQMRMQKLAARKGGKYLEGLEAFNRGGMAGLRKFDDTMAQELAGGSFLHLGSVFYPASEAIGKITAGFSPHAKALRMGGLGGKITADTARLAQTQREQLADKLWSIVREDGSEMPPAEVQKFLVDAYNLGGVTGKRVGKDAPRALDELFDDVYTYMHLMPTAQGMKDGAATYYDQLIADAIKTFPAKSEDLAERLAVLRDLRQKAIDAEAKLRAQSDTALEATRYLRLIDDAAQNELLRSGIENTRSVHSSKNAAPALPTKQARELASEGHFATKDVAVVIEDVRGMDLHNIDASAVRDQGSMHTARGLQVEAARPWDVPARADAGIDGLPPEPTVIDPGSATTTLPEASGVVTRRVRYERGVRGTMARGGGDELPVQDGTEEWARSVFGAGGEVGPDAARAYGRGVGASVFHLDVLPGARILVEGTPEYDAVVLAARQLKGKFNDRLVIAARDGGWDVVQMNDQDYLGTAIINKDMVEVVGRTKTDTVFLTDQLHPEQLDNLSAQQRERVLNIVDEALHDWVYKQGGSSEGVYRIQAMFAEWLDNPKALNLTATTEVLDGTTRLRFSPIDIIDEAFGKGPAAQGRRAANIRAVNALEETTEWFRRGDSKQKAIDAATAAGEPPRITRMLDLIGQSKHWADPTNNRFAAQTDEVAVGFLDQVRISDDLLDPEAAAAAVAKYADESAARAGEAATEAEVLAAREYNRLGNEAKALEMPGRPVVPTPRQLEVEARRVALRQQYPHFAEEGQSKRIAGGMQPTRAEGAPVEAPKPPTMLSDPNAPSPIAGWNNRTYELEKAKMERGIWDGNAIPTLEYDPQTGKMLLTDGNHRLALAKHLGYTHIPVRTVIRYRGPKTLTKGLSVEGGPAGDVVKAQLALEQTRQMYESIATLRSVRRAVTEEGITVMTSEQRQRVSERLIELELEFKKTTGRFPTTDDGDLIRWLGVEEGIAERFGVVPDGKGGFKPKTDLFEKLAKRPAGALPPERLRGSQTFSDGTVAMSSDLATRDVVPTSALGRTGETQEFAARPLNLFVRDLRANKTRGRFLGPTGSEEEDVYDLAVQRANELLDRIEGQAEEMPEWFDELDPFVQHIVAAEVDRTSKVAELVTADMRGQGYDGIWTITDEKEGGTFFLNPETGRPPVARVDDAAAYVQPLNGTVPLVFTKQAVEAAGGVAAGPPAWMSRLQKRVTGMGRKEAEDEVRREFARRGVRLTPQDAVFETDPLRIANRYIERVSRDIVNQHLGRQSRRMDRMGFARSPFMGEVTTLTQYRYALNDTTLQAIYKVSEQAGKAQERAAKLQLDTLPQLESEARQMADRLAAFHSGGDEAYNEVLGALRDAQMWGARETPEEALARAAEGNPIPATAYDAGEVSAARMPDPDWNTNKDFRSVMRGGPDATGTQQPPIPRHPNAGAARTAGDELWLEDLGDGYFVLKDWRGSANNVHGYHRHTYFKWNDDQGVLEGIRDVAVARRDNGSIRSGGVSTAVSNASQRQGIGLRLLRLHWQDMGIDQDPKAILSAIRANTQSLSGNLLNRKAAKDVFEEMYEAARREADERVSKVSMRANEAIMEYNRAVARLRTKVAETRPALLPAEGAGTMTGFERVAIPGFTDVAMPSFMAQELYHAARGFKGLNDFQKVYRRFTTWWKEWATFMWPGFHVRNAMGAWFNNFLQGVGFSDYVLASRIRRAAHEMMTTPESEWKWANMRVRAKDGDFLKVSGLDTYWAGIKNEPTYSDLANMVSEYGITATHGRAFAEARVGTEYLEEKLAKRRGFERIPFIGTPYVKAAKGAGTLTENLFRTASFVRGLRDAPGDFAAARVNVMLRHGDYQDLTDWEFGIVRDLIPFYKWMRTNVPYQLHQLFESPGKLLAAQKLRGAVYTGMGKDYDEEQFKMPGWMRESFTVPLGSDDAFNVAMLDLPMSDLFIDGRDFVSSFLPMVRPVLESYVFEQSTFSGSPIGDEMVPLNPVFDILNPVLGPLGLTKRGVDGRSYISSKTQNLLGIIPMYSRLRNWMEADPDRIRLRANTFTSSVLGMGLRPVDREAMTTTELGFYYNQVQPQLEQLRSLGVELPTTQDLEQIIGDTDVVLHNLGIVPGGVAAQAA